MFIKIVKGILIGLAALIALSYTFGYDYLFKGIRETYFRGETGSTIADYKFNILSYPCGRNLFFEL